MTTAMYSVTTRIQTNEGGDGHLRQNCFAVFIDTVAKIKHAEALRNHVAPRHQTTDRRRKTHHTNWRYSTPPLLEKLNHMPLAIRRSDVAFAGLRRSGRRSRRSRRAFRFLRASDTILPAVVIGLSACARVREREHLKPG